MKEVVVEYDVYKSIPYVLYTSVNMKKAPVIIVGHGFNNDKLEGSKLALRLAWKGFSVICFDLHNQGDRYNGFMESIENDCQFGTVLFNVIEESAKDVDHLFELIDQDSRLDGNRVGFVGISHGANLGFYTLSQNKRIKTLVSLIGAPDFISLIVDGMEKEGLEDFETEEEKILLSYVKSLNPLDYLIHEEVRPMMIINGSKDDNVPYVFSETYYKKVKERYDTIGGDIVFEVEDEYHYVSDTMLDKSVSWLEKHLLGS